MTTRKQADGELTPCPLCPPDSTRLFHRKGLPPHVRSQHPEYTGPIFGPDMAKHTPSRGHRTSIVAVPEAQREQVADAITLFMENPTLALSAIDMRLEEEHKAMQMAKDEMAKCEARIEALQRLKEQFAPEHIERAPRRSVLARDVA